MNLLKEKINPYTLKVLEKCDVIDKLDHGLLIAGGFGKLIYDLNKENQKDEITKRLLEFFRKSDIDFYSNSKEHLNNYLDKLKNKKNRDVVFWESKFAESATKYMALNNFIITSLSTISIKYQFVNKFFFKTVEELFNNFDFENCKYCILKEKDDYFILRSPKANYYNDLKEIKICHNGSPLLGLRIYKYITFKDMENGISECSLPIFEEWLFKLASHSFSEEYLFKESDFYNLSKILISLKSKINIKDELLVLFLNKINVHVFEQCSSYGISMTKKVDWAANELNKNGAFINGF